MNKKVYQAVELSLEELEVVTGGSNIVRTGTTDPTVSGIIPQKSGGYEPIQIEPVVLKTDHID